MIVNAIIWVLNDQIDQATCSEPAPPGGTEGPICSFFPSSISHGLNLWALDTQAASEPSCFFKIITGGPGYLPIHEGCSVCAITPRWFMEGKLIPLPVPQRSWSHVGINFMTDLPSFNYNNCVFVVVDRFSKACKLIPMKGLPTALEVTELLFQHVHHFGLLEESERGPQSIS